jgi:hypothetical protein
MRRKLVSMFAAAGWFWLAVATPAQQPAAQTDPSGPPAAAVSSDPPKAEKKPAASSLENLLAKALKDNSDIRVAESKVREAEAQLNKARMEVMQKIVKLYHEIAANKALVDIAKQRLDRVKLLQERGAIAQEEASAAEQALQQAKANLAKVETEMPFLLGTQPLLPYRLSVRTHLRELADFQLLDEQSRLADYATVAQALRAVGQRPPGAVKETIAERIRQVLNTPVQGEFTQEKLLKLFEERAKGFNVIYLVPVPWQIGVKEYSRPTIRFKEPIPLGAALQWLEDSTQWAFVVRDYGIVVTGRRAIPPGAAVLADLWKDMPSKNSVKKLEK